MDLQRNAVLDSNREEFLGLINEAHSNSDRHLREVGDLCAVDHTYIWRILRGERRPSRGVLLALCLTGWGLDIYETDHILRQGGYKTIMNWQKAGWD